MTLLAAATTGCGKGDALPHPRNALPDVVLVSVDSLRFDHLGCYGYPRATSPAIDRLASEGVRCETVASTSSWTLPAHAALLTGLDDSSHGVVDNGLRLARGTRTLAAVMRDAGWRTAGFFGGPYLDPEYGFGEGFDVFRSCMSPTATSSLRDVTGPRTVEAVSRWLDEEEGSKDARPFFLFLHLWDVHYDYIPPAGYAERFDPDYSGRLDARDLPNNPAVEPGMAPRDLEHLLALYDGEILSTDENLGRILAELDRRGRLRDALVIVTADHGEEFFEHGGKGHQKTLFDEVVRVPLILRWPGHLPPGRVVKEPVRLIDLMPTVLALAGVRERPPMQGRDIGPLLRGEPMDEVPALMELSVDRNDVRALRTSSTKVISWRRAGVARVYDLVRDPREERPLAETSPLYAAGLAALDLALREAAGFRGAGRAEPVEIGADLRRRLGILGYAGDDSPPAQPGPK